MNTLTPRPVALAVLLLTVLALSGASFAEAAFSSPGTADSPCCFPSGHGDELPQAPCTTPECLCLFCLNLHLARFTDVSLLPLFSASPVFHRHPPPPAIFVRSIDYPPEHA